MACGVAPEATARGEHDFLGRTRSPGPSEARGQVSLTETARSVVRLPGRATCATYGVRLDLRHWIQLPIQTPDASFEVVYGELEVDGLLETNGGGGLKNTGRTGRDRC